MKQTNQAIREHAATMKTLPKEDRPYEKCIAQGASALGNAELLAVILRTGTEGRTSLDLANEILNHCHYEKGLTGLLHMGIPELMEIRGIGIVKAAQLQCICELSKRIAKSSAKKSLSFQNPSSIANYYMETLRHEEQEMVLCMMLDTKGHLLGEKILSRGTVNQSLISPRELFLEAFTYHAVQLILVHNHPSGDPTPSPDDIAITRRVAEAGALLGIYLIDHIVIGEKSYVSFLEEGLLNGK